MRILIADDDDVSRLALEAALSRRGFEVVAAADGAEAWRILQGDDPPPLVILDWMMPELDGIEVCRRARAEPGLRALYMILLTSQDGRNHVLEGLRSGANDYVTKPFDREELEARVNVGVHVVGLQGELAARIRELEAALVREQQLEGLLPICSYCKSIRDDQNYWHRVEAYFREKSGAQFSHSICPDCWKDIAQKELRSQGCPAAPYPG